MKDMENSSIWGFLNSVDKRVWIGYSSNTMFGMYDTLKKLHYKDVHCSPLLVKDYNENKLELVVFQYIEKIPSKGKDIRTEILKGKIMEEYVGLGYALYNQRNVKKMFASICFVKQLSISGEEEQLVYVVLKPKQEVPDVTKHVVVGVFSSVPEAKLWCKEAYGDYQSFPVSSVITAQNALTIRHKNNVIFQDKAMLKQYKKLFSTKKRTHSS